MGYIYSFADNVSYSASDINSVISKIVTGGVCEVFNDGASYNTSDLNKIANFVANYGVVHSNNTTLKVVANGLGYVKVCEGTAFFNDGASLTVDSAGVSLSYSVGSVNYVYLKNNLISLNNCEVICSTQQGNGDIITLATINEDGSITDTRVYISGKLPAYQSNFGTPKIITVNYSFAPSTTKCTTTVDLGASNYTHIFDITTLQHSYTNDVIDNSQRHMGAYNILNNKYLCMYYEKSDFGMYQNKLLIRTRYSTNSAYYGVSVTFGVDGSNLICNFSLEATSTASSFKGSATFLVC